MGKIIAIGLINRIILLVVIGMLFVFVWSLYELDEQEKVASTWTEHKGMYSGSFEGSFNNSAGKDLSFTMNAWQDTLTAMMRIEILEIGSIRPNIPNRSFVNAWVNAGRPGAEATELYYIGGIFLDKERKVATALSNSDSEVVLHIMAGPNRALEYFISLPPFPSQDNTVLSIGYGKVASPKEWALGG